jgi:hypothetical protein
LKEYEPTGKEYKYQIKHKNPVNGSLIDEKRNVFFHSYSEAYNSGVNIND